MNYDVMYSLRMALETNLPEVTEAQMLYDGVELSSANKPFLTIQYLQESPEVMAAGRESYRDTYHYRVGVFARNINELMRLESKVRKVVREKYGHPLYQFDDVTGAFVDTGELVPYTDNGFTPMTNDDSSDKTNDHRGYFDVAIPIY